MRPTTPTTVRSGCTKARRQELLCGRASSATTTNTKDKSAVTGNVNNGAVQATVEGTSALLAAGGIIGRNDVGAVSGCRNFGAVACALHAGALVGWNKKSVEDSAAGGSVNGTALTGTNYAELAVGFQDGGSSSGITFGEK